MEMLNQKQKVIAVIVIAIVVVVIGYYYLNSTKEIYTNSSSENMIEESENEIVEKIPEKIKIHITGAIKKNGVVEVEEKARIDDVIEAAGGITEDADLTNINLAYKVEDGQKIYIPSLDDKNNKQEEKELDIISSGAGNEVIKSEEKEETLAKLININKASLTELMSLPGIGQATAANIIEYRQINGTFKTIEQLKNVTGIGEAKFNTIRELITV